MNHRKFLTAIFLIIFCLFDAKPALTGHDLNQTISMLKGELGDFINRVDESNTKFDSISSRLTKTLQKLDQDLTSAELSLYSQQDRYVFGQSYTASHALSVCKRFEKLESPMESWIDSYNRSIKRCEAIQTTLLSIPNEQLNAQAIKDKNQCLSSLDSTLNLLYSWKENIVLYQESFNKIGERVKNLHTQVDDDMQNIHQRVFFHKDLPFLYILSEWGYHWKAFCNDMKVFLTFDYTYSAKSDWLSDMNIVIGVTILSFLLGVLLCRFVFIKHIQKKLPYVKEKTFTFIILSGWIFLIIAYSILYLFVFDNPFFKSGTLLGIELCLMSIAMISSVILRVRSGEFFEVLSLYSPTFFITILTLGYRIFLVDDAIIRVSFFPLLLIITIAQFILILIRRHQIPLFDRIVSDCSLSIYVICSILAFNGYMLLSLQIALFWSILLIGHLIITCFFQFLGRCEHYQKKKGAKAYYNSFKHLTLKRLLRPLSVILVYSFCIIQCAQIFNIDSWVQSFFKKMFIDQPGIARISINRIILIVLLGFLVYYLIGIVKFILRKIYGKSAEVGAINLSSKISSLLIWGLYGIISLSIIEINSMGIIAALGGLTVGLGIALRDTFDCFICGVSMMMGRVKIGDIIECGDDIRGKVVDIQYRTTQILTDDGATISIFNSSLFKKEFRNVSRTGEFERLRLIFKVQKEIDSPKVREMLRESLIKKVPQLKNAPAPKILFHCSDRFYVEMIAQVWIPVNDYYDAISNVKETLFIALKEHGMSNMSVDSRVRVVKLEHDV